MADKISVDKLQVGIDIITESVSFGVLVDSLDGTEVGEAKAKLGEQFILMLGLLMDDIRDMNQDRALL